MRGICRLVAVALAAVLVTSIARGDAVTDAADGAARAAKAGDATVLEALAAKDAPDPWVVADELLARGDAESAAKFAKAKPRRDVEKLPGYVASRAGKSDDAALRKMLADANAKLASKDAAGALAAMEAAKDLHDDVVSARIEYGRGIALRALARNEEALAVYTSVAARAERFGWLARASEAHHQAGTTAMALGDYGASLQIWLRKLEFERTRGSPRAIGRTLVTLGTVYDTMGDPAKARASYEEGEAIALKAGERDVVLAAQGNAAILLRRLGDYEKSTAKFEEVAAALHAAGNRSGEATMRINLASNHKDLGKLDKAMAEMDAALALTSDGANEKLLADVLVHRGEVLRELGRRDEALADLEKGLKLSEKLGDKRGIAGAYQQIASLSFDLAQYARALSFQEKALAIYEAGGDVRGMSIVLQNLTNTHCALADHEKALACVTRCLEIVSAAGEDRAEGGTRNSLGTVLIRLKRTPEAIEEFKKALAAFRAQGDDVGASGTLANLGAAYSDLGRSDEAIVALTEAVKSAEERGDREGVAVHLGNLGNTYAGKKDFEKAIEHLARGAQVAREVHAEASIAENTWGLAHYYALAGRNKEAVAAAREAIAAIATLVAGLGDEQGARTREQYASVYEYGTVAGMQMNDPAEACFFLESGRAGTLLETLGGHDAIAGFAVPETLRKEDDAARAELSAAMASQHQAIDARKLPAIQAARARVASAAARVQTSVERIQRESKLAASVVYPVAAKLDDIRARLAPGDAFVEYGVFKKAAIALVATRKESRILLLGMVPDLESACAGIDPSDASVAPDAGLAALRKIVVEPLALDAAVTRVLVSPDGPLCVVPFSLLLPDREVVSVPSGSAWLLLSEDAAKTGVKVLALGDPVYDGSAGAVATRSLKGAKLSPLPATRDEAKAVGDVVLLGTGATVPGLAAAAARQTRWHAIHLACHGLVDSDNPSLSALALSADATSDGLLKGIDVFRMRLPSDLVVLSACETGRGKVVRGEGIVGFTRSFMFAGSPRVVVSLWKVDDQATRALMERFHASWKAGASASAALRDAQTFVRSQEKWKHPAYWAAWVLWGLPE